ncbi:MAG: aminotransferase class I/II-fold pyridoxal phosphate-dependent enzyme [Verrucomicrobiota bacterium]|nr:aminotransferase class I/II-fold pyridoxal phosphate-dependent enzyme [Verrucomicrobiota bacterium]
MPKDIKVNQNIIEMEYAIRGPIPQRAAEMASQGMKTIFCNIGNPQALDQQPLTFNRQIISLLENPSLIKRERKLKKILDNNSDFKEHDFFSEYVLNYAEKILEALPSGLGAYTQSKGALFIREAIASFINKRDRIAPSSNNVSDPEKIFITNGAGDGAKYILDLLISDKNDGVMIPIPQYPLYSATIRTCGACQVNYYPDEENGWTFSREMLDNSLSSAKKKGVKVKCIVVINPGNPTGAVLDKKSISEVIEFAGENNLSIIADEVYQGNVYDGEFISFARVLGNRDIPLFSLHSVSKGFIGECGHRGGYFEMRNTPQIKGAKHSFNELILKQASVNLCSNTVGQIMVYLMVNPPMKNSEAYHQYILQKKAIIDSLYAKALMIKKSFKEMEGVKCFGRIAAMYLFPRLSKLPTGTNDFDYCMSLLEETGLCTVNGSGFGQKRGTSHLRIAFLPPKEQLAEVLPLWIKFHNEYVSKK